MARKPREGVRVQRIGQFQRQRPGSAGNSNPSCEIESETSSISMACDLVPLRFAALAWAAVWAALQMLPSPAQAQAATVSVTPSVGPSETPSAAAAMAVASAADISAGVTPTTSPDATAAPVSASTRQLPLWALGLGVGGLRLPHYRGADQAHGWLLPVPYYVYRGKILRADRDGARALLFDGDRFDLDLSLNASAPAKSGDDPARQGMPDLAATLEFGPKLNVVLARAETWKLDLRLPVRAVTTIESHPHGIGWSAAPVLNLDLRLPVLDLGVQAGPLWGDRRLHGYFYDVAPEFATAARPAYRAPGGYAGWQATSGLSRRSGNLWMGGFVRFDSVAGAAFEPSPLVTSRRQWSLGLAVSWVFATSGTMVSVED